MRNSYNKYITCVIFRNHLKDDHLQKYAQDFVFGLLRIYLS